MFSITCAQNMAKLLVLPSELEAWEKMRLEKSIHLQRRRAEQRRTAKFQQGYGPGGRVPPYVEAHVLSLEASPLARPVFSPGRGLRACSVARRPDRSCSTATRRRIIRTRPSFACLAMGSRTKVNGGNGRPDAAAGRCVTSHATQKLKSKQSAVSCQAKKSFDGGGGVARPATAPCARPTKAPASLRKPRDCFPAGMEACQTKVDGEDRGEEARLVEKLALLAGGKQAHDFPTVAALKTAMAIEAVHTQLREYHGRSMIDRTLAAAGSSQKTRAVSVPTSQRPCKQQAAAAATGGTGVPLTRCSSARARRCRTGRQQQEVEPWNNLTLFITRSDRPRTTSNAALGSPMSTATPAIITLTRHDPAFGWHDASSPPPSQSQSSWRRPHSVGSHSPLPGRLGATSPSYTRDKRGMTREQNSCAPTSAAVAAPPVATTACASGPATAPSAPEIQMKTCFQKLTVDALIELGHLRNPPKPVVAVLAGLACLLGWKRSSNPPTNKNSHSYYNKKHQHYHSPPPRLLFSNAYVLRDLLASILPRRICSRRLSAITERLSVPEAEPTKVQSINAAAAALLDWLLAVVACARPNNDCDIGALGRP